MIEVLIFRKESDTADDPIRVRVTEVNEHGGALRILKDDGTWFVPNGEPGIFKVPKACTLDLRRAVVCKADGSLVEARP